VNRAPAAWLLLYCLATQAGKWQYRLFYGKERNHNMAHNKNKRFPLKLTVAGLAVAWTAASFMLHLPPASWIPNTAAQASGAIDGDAATTAFPEKPPFRFGSRTLDRVCREYALDTDTILRELAGFAVRAEPEWSIKRIAEENDMETAALFEVIRELSLNRGQQLDMRN
jgi:hypothetical protein